MSGKFRLAGFALILGLTAWSCGDTPNPIGAASTGGGPARLAKLAGTDSAMVVARLMQNGAPVAGAQVALAQSVSGLPTQYRWMGTTDTDGMARIAMAPGTEPGYYTVRATDPATGTPMGAWGSVPINRGNSTAMLLPVGGAARTTQTSTYMTRFRVRIENVSTAHPFPSSGVFNTPVGASAPGPIGPGAAFEFSFDAPPGARLSFATMFGQSNDFFYAPDENGIALWDASGHPVSGDVTSQVKLWDAGTEVNQEPGLGPDQAPREAAPNTGAPDPNPMVRPAPDTFHNLPPVSSVIRVTVTPVSETRFRVRIENVGTSTTLMTSDGGKHPAPLSPGVYVVHTTPGPLFTVGQPDRGQGLESLAEDGNPAALGAFLAGQTGLTVPLSPVAWVLHTADAPLFTAGQPDRGQGLESLAEDGNPAALGTSLAAQGKLVGSGVVTTGVGASAPGPIGPGGAFEFSFQAFAGSHLSFATMFAQSNDFFYAPGERGIALWDVYGNPVSGDVTSQVRLWDAGTEVNQKPGVGPDQAPRQAAPNTGAPDPDRRVRPAPDTFHNLPLVSSVIRVTITPEP